MNFWNEFFHALSPLSKVERAVYFQRVIQFAVLPLPNSYITTSHLSLLFFNWLTSGILELQEGERESREILELFWGN